MFKKNTTIRQRVLAVVEARIAAAQKKYDERVAELEAELEVQKNNLADAVVGEVLNGVIDR